MSIRPDLKISDLYRGYPAALPVLAKYRIDLCCGGRHSLEEVARKRDLDLEQLLKDLEEAVREAS
jgi:regulator of cell morphogenesis and NO signaling